MIRKILPILLVLSVQAFAKTKAPELSGEEYSKVAVVYGMVCAFCSNSLEQKFKKQKAVEKIFVDLESQKVKVKFKKGKSLSDKKLKKMITASGFKVVSIKDFEHKGNEVDKK